MIALALFRGALKPGTPVLLQYLEITSDNFATLKDSYQSGSKHKEKSITRQCNSGLYLGSDG